MFRSVTRCLVFLLLCLLTASVYAQQFSADGVDLRPDRRQNPVKLYVSNDKMRYEVHDAQDKMSGSNVAMIWDTARQTRYVLMMDRHMYMDYSPLLASKLPIVPIWHPSDINNACPEWQKFVDQFHDSKWGTCHKVGSDTLNGRSTIKYSGTSSDGKSGNVWIDAKLHYVTKLQDQDGGGFELRNIQEGPQPANLFEVPPGYQKFDMGNMRIPQR
jgi:hypothetical protein